MNSLKTYAFEASGRWSQVHFVEARSAKEARALFDLFEVKDSLEFAVTRTSVRRAPEYDEDA